MKAISIRQPFGSLICCGLKDVENRSWAVKTTPMRVLIHVGARPMHFYESDPECWLCDVDNYQQMGILPTPLSKLPLSAIIGVATIDKCDTHYPSVWSQLGHGAEYHWVVKDVRLFKNPILGVKGKLGFFDVPEISEDNLPECVDVVTEQRDGARVFIPMERESFAAAKKCKGFTFYVTKRNKDIFFGEDGNLLDTEEVTLTCGDDKLVFVKPTLEFTHTPDIYSERKGKDITGDNMDFYCGTLDVDA